MIETSNLKLKKYQDSDNADPSLGMNPNMDIIDTEIKKLQDGKSNNGHTHAMGEITGLELSSTKVNRPNGETVEQSLIENETSISTNKNDISSLKTKTDTTNTNVSNLYDGFDSSKLKGENFIKTYPGQFLTSGYDLNNLKFNFVGYTSSSLGVLNLPPGSSGGAGHIECTVDMRNNGTIGHVKQEYTNTTQNTMFVRCYNVDSDTWTSWREL